MRSHEVARLSLYSGADHEQATVDPAADARGFAGWSGLRRIGLGTFRNRLRRCTSRTWRAVAGGRRGVTVTQVLTVTRTASVAIAVGVARSAAVAFACSPPPPPPPPPAPPPPPPAVEEPAPAEAYYANCAAARSAGAAPIQRGEPGDRKGLDRDNDGTACDK